MPLPHTGTISLNQIHVAAGGSSGTTASINDADIRALNSKSSGVQMSFSEWYSLPSGVSYASEFIDQYSPEAVVVGYYYEDDDYREPTTGIDIRLVKTSSGFEVKVSLGHDPSSDHSGYMQDDDYNETSLSNASEALMFELTSETVDALKLDYSVTPVIEQNGDSYADFEITGRETPVATYNASDNVWQTLATNESMGIRFLSYTMTVDPYASGENSASVGADITLNIWARKASRSDTLMATYLLRIDATNIALEY